MPEIFDAAEWFESLTLVEREPLLGEGSKELSPERSERAARKVQRWRSESDLLDDGLFIERFALEGLTPDRLLRILAEPASGLQRRAVSPPEWLQGLARTFSRPASENGHSLGILELLRPLISETHGHVLDRLRQIEEAPIEPGPVTARLLETLLKRLRWASERTLALELHASRLEGKLQGDTPEERFSSFISSLQQPGTALEILQRYPVLARDACRHADQWAETSLEMIERFVADREEIVRLFAGGEDPGALVDAQIGLSDRHAGGRSVAILEFRSGFRVVYKPKSLIVDLRFQELVAWLNDRGATPPLQCLKILDRGSYGWMEHIAASPCATMDEVERFHERQGAWVALFYALEATDFHHENLIAVGEHPVPVDLETLFQPVFADQPASGPGSVPTAHTVLRSGLLPRRFWGNAMEAGIDLSGMGATGGQDVPIKRITDEGTDQMRWALHQTRMEAGPNVPTLNGKPLSLWDHGEAVLRGFRSMYHLLRRHREDLLAPGGPLDSFTGLPIRTLLRGTTVYAHLLHVGHHPDYLQSALDRDRLYDRLWLDAKRYPRLRRALQAERDDLIVGDIPRFEAVTDSTDLLHPKCGRIEGFFAEPGLELVRKRLWTMDDDDLERQSWLVRASIEAMRPLDERRAWTATPLPETGPVEPAEPERFLVAARGIGNRLSQLAVEQDGFVSWFCLEISDNGWRLEPMNASLYSGLSGIALFLAQLGHLTGDERSERLARLAVHTIRKRIEADPEVLVRPGAFSGWGGVVYTLTHLGALWDEPELLDEAERLAARIAAGLEKDDAYDLIAGAAGGIVPLLELHRHRPSRAVLDVAVRCGEHLLATAITDERGQSWPPIPGVSELPLTGFGHGTAGIAWALARLAQVTGEERFREAARGAMRYERSWFCSERGNWPDLRESRETSDGRSFMHAWCHGAPGIGLGRIGSLPCLDDPEMRDEIRAAARSTLAGGFGFNHSLCHGDLGNLELVREAGRALGDEELTSEAGRLAARILTRIETEGPRCGASVTTEIPGLLVGIAGIGYGLLRAAHPDHVPSVLLLETPETAL